MIRSVGLDVHKRLVEVCALDQAGQVVLRHRFSLQRDNLIRFAREMLTREDRVVLEASTNCWAVVKVLKPFVAEEVVSNPLQTRFQHFAPVFYDRRAFFPWFLGVAQPRRKT